MASPVVEIPSADSGDGGSIPGTGRGKRRRRKWQPTPVLLPGKSHAQRSLANHTPRGRKRVGRDRVTKEHRLSCDVGQGVEWI